MTEYKFISTTEPPISSHAEVNEKKEKRRKQLEAVFQRRREIYKRFIKEKRLQATGTTHSGYQIKTEP